MKLAVTAASGQLGTAIVRQLIADVGEKHVVAIARTPSKADHLGVETRKGDYTRISDFDAALKGVDGLVIVSGNDAPEKRIEQHRNIIDAAKKSGVKKIAYVSIIGDDSSETAFSPVIRSNRQTEKDVQASGLEWVVGRNGLYIEPDLEYIEKYKAAGEISNCAGAGLCCYTCRTELGRAYSQLLRDEKFNGHTYNLTGEAITQEQLTSLINEAFRTNLEYRPVSVAEYLADRKAELGDFIGTIIAGIYEGIKLGSFNVRSDFAEILGRSHKQPEEMIAGWKK